MKLSTKSSSAAKLFNAVHKAQVSWNRIRPLLDSVNEEEDGKEWEPGDLEVKDVSFAYPDGKRVLEHVSFSAKPGQIIGVTGPVACGKSTLGSYFYVNVHMRERYDLQEKICCRWKRQNVKVS